uniref:Pentraxin family member n=1 Tax=Sphaeramia orbicularis TaxID=375764 RepID=A0A673AHA4_9TELE
MKSMFFVLIGMGVTNIRPNRSLIFPSETDNSYVELTPKRPLNLQAFTLCMRVATELSGNREIILFAYRTTNADEMWRRLSLYLSASSGATFQVPDLGALQSHLCFTWDSGSGATALFMNGKKSLTKIYRKNHNVSSGGKTILGQDPDSLLGDFEADQSFVGEINDVNMWSSVLSDRTIQDMFSGMRVPRPDVLDWKTTQLQKHGGAEILTTE